MLYQQLHKQIDNSGDPFDVVLSRDRWHIIHGHKHMNYSQSNKENSVKSSMLKRCPPNQVKRIEYPFRKRQIYASKDCCIIHVVSYHIIIISTWCISPPYIKKKKDCCITSLIPSFVPCGPPGTHVKKHVTVLNPKLDLTRRLKLFHLCSFDIVRAALNAMWWRWLDWMTNWKQRIDIL